MAIKSNIGNTVNATTSYTSTGGRIASGLKGHAYKCPYPIKFPGLLLGKALSTSYDTSAGTYPVVIPCTAGALPDGWAYTTTAKTDVPAGVFELGLYFYPETANLGDSGYAEDEIYFTEISSMPCLLNEKVSIPLAASQTVSVNSEIACGGSGLARVAQSGDFVIGIAEEAISTASGTVTTTNVSYVPVKFIQSFKKA